MRSSPTHDACEAAMARLGERAPQVLDALRCSAEPLLASAPRVLACSPFVLEVLASEPSLLSALLEPSADGFAGTALPVPQPPEGLDGASETQFMAQLRRWRRCELARIAWRDLAGWADLRETLLALSGAAECAVRAAHEYAHRALTERHGQPLSTDGSAQQLIVVAMGKLGGEELNFSSDIDLVLLYPQAGQTDGARPLSNEEFFTRVGQRFVRLLGQPSAEGQVYRVDLRLRPFGTSGPVVTSGAALEDYLQTHGRDWERYAWVKARALTNQAAYAELFRETVRPFVYRRYLDFGVFESLQEMKGRIEREVRRRELQADIKLGEGGIREIEFIVQSFQLVRGGSDRQLQTPSLHRALGLLGGAKLLDRDAVAGLGEAYAFLRRLENRLQMREDAQVHRLPVAPAERELLALAMGVPSWRHLDQQIAVQRERVAGQFRAVVFAAPAPEADADRLAPFEPGLTEANEEQGAALQRWLEPLGFADGTAAASALSEFASETRQMRLVSGARRRLERLLPLLLVAVAGRPEPLAGLRRLLKVLRAIGARSTYFSLLLQSAPARARLVELTAHGDFLTDQIARHPLLLDELLDEQLFERVPDRVSLRSELARRMAGLDQEDAERLVEALSDFQRAALFRIAVADLLSGLPVMQVSDRLTELAELIIEQALELTWRQLSPRLGVPMCGQGAERRPVRLCVVGYGKLGGSELGYASDLDLVFLHDSEGPDQETEGAAVLDNQVFFVRFAQRLVHLLTMHSAAGRLYEVDMRLRPSGKGGLLITRIGAFSDYQREEAWTWEHQALLHARAVAGAPALRARFEAVRLEVLTRYVRRDRLQQDVRHMRQRMRAELSHARAGQVDLKQDPGGIADIEFLAQYWALRWAPGHAPLVYFADTIRQLESLGSADLVPQERIDLLTTIYRSYRSRLHHRALEGLGEVIEASELVAERRAVTAIWDEAMG